MSYELIGAFALAVGQVSAIVGLDELVGMSESTELNLE
jgi:hypothetical protein